ncbi:MAG: (d)CMP kinase [Peptococcaceae bacterium]|jgi:cytidylate kinase|nr:(d)CMP kinase [Peptococcaceae bacterium]
MTENLEQGYGRNSGQANVAIDGPSGAGKSTVARLVAHRLGLGYVDTGAMYRAVALRVLEEGADPDDHAALGRLARETRIETVPGDGGLEIWVNGRNVTAAIRSGEVSATVARVAAVPQVRAWLVERQRELAAGSPVVMEGRDIGTNVLPGAPYKFFITADPAVRARRRAFECRAETQPARDAVAREMSERDRLDAGRSQDPLGRARDAVVIDSTGLTAVQVAERILAHVAGRV